MRAVLLACAALTNMCGLHAASLPDAVLPLAASRLQPGITTALLPMISI
jgi:hypothetical protein